MGFKKRKIGANEGVISVQAVTFKKVDKTTAEEFIRQECFVINNPDYPVVSTKDARIAIKKARNEEKEKSIEAINTARQEMKEKLIKACEEKFLWMFTEESRLELIEEFKKELEE